MMKEVVPHSAARSSGLPPAAAGAAGDEEAGSPLLRAVDWGTASFIISDHVGTWVDLEPVG